MVESLDAMGVAVILIFKVAGRPAEGLRRGGKSILISMSLYPAVLSKVLKHNLVVVRVI